MNNEQIILIAIVAAVFLLGIICLLIAVFKAKKKGTQTEILTESKDLIASNAQVIEVLLVLAKGKERATNELSDIKDKIKFLTPSTDERVTAIDEKIKAELGDIKIELNKKKDEEKDDKVFVHIDNIRLKLAERSVFTDKL